MRIARVIEGSQTVAVLVGAERIARSPGGVTIALDGDATCQRARWTRDHGSCPVIPRRSMCNHAVVGGR